MLYTVKAAYSYELVMIVGKIFFVKILDRCMNKVVTKAL